MLFSAGVTIGKGWFQQICGNPDLCNVGINSALGLLWMCKLLQARAAAAKAINILKANMKKLQPGSCLTMWLEI